ncbi:MAG: His Kinase (phospho-acceptor) domain [Cyanobacteria bacterium RYN_339]|nr:His Kinase (phospho-acceptor) domain [Cyanobacteria bacterium RYN_339]
MAMNHTTTGPNTPCIGAYRLLHERGEGATAKAYLAEHPADGGLVILKVAHAWNPLIETAFRQEFLLGSRLRHPHLGEVLDHGRTEAGRPFLVLAFDDGAPLTDTPGPWNEAQVARLGLQLARGLAVLHAQGWVHRDVTPGNVLVGDGGLARLIDFGMITTAGQAGAVAGTPLYLAPELLAGEEVDARADLYSLGALLYRQAGGKAPFEELEAEALLHAVLHDTPWSITELAPHLSPPLAALITRLLAKAPGDRPADCVEVIRILEPLATGPALPLTEGAWQAPSAWEAWEGLAVQPGAFAVSGPAGSGRSRFLQEAFRQVRRTDLPALLLAGEATAGPYALAEAIARWAAALAPDALAALDEDVLQVLAPLWGWIPTPETPAEAGPEEGDALPPAITAALAALLEAVANGGRLAIMIDGWEDADPASRALLKRAWGQALGRWHWLVGAQEAPGEARAWELAPADAPAWDAWVATCFHGRPPEGLAARLFQATGGNMGWAVQAMQALSQGGGELALPDSVGAALEQQFGHLTRSQRLLAEALAFYAAPFALEDLTPLGEVLPGGWPLEIGTLVARGLLELRGGSYRWANGWWPNWVRAQAAPGRIQRLCWDLARALEQHWFGTVDQRPVALLRRLAELYARSQDADATLRWALAAGRACAAIFANDSALAHFDDGLAVAPAQGPERRALEASRADLLRRVGRQDEAVAAYERLLPGAEGAERGRLLTSLGKCHLIRNRFQAAQAALEEAVALLEPAGTPTERLRSLTTLGRTFYLAGQREVSQARYEEALALARTHGDRAHQAEALSMLGQMLAGRAATAGEGLTLLQQALELREELRDHAGQLDTHMLLGNALYSQGRFGQARERFKAYREGAARVGDRVELAYADINLALTASELGQYQEVRVHAPQARALDDSFLVGLASYMEAHAALHLGDLPTVDAALAVARAKELALGNDELRLYGLIYEAERHLFLGAFDQALRAGELAQALVEKGVASELAPRVQLVVTEALVFQGQAGRARQALARAQAAIDAAGAVAPRARAGRLEGWLALQEGDVSAARDHWQLALELAQAKGLQAVALPLLLDLASLARRGHPVEPGALQAAYDLAEQARQPEALGAACLGLAAQHLEGGHDLLADRLSRRGQELLATYGDWLPSQGARLMFEAHPARAPFCNVKQQEESHRLARRGKRLEMLLSLAEKLAARRDPEAVLGLVREFTLEITQAERCLILLQHGPGQLHTHAEGEYSHTLVERVVATRQAECILDAQADEGLKAQRSILDLRVRSVMCVPLAVDTVLHGVLYVDSQVALGTFTPEDLRVVEAIARQAALALDGARLLTLLKAQVRQRDEHIRRLNESDQVIQHLKELDRVRGEYFEAESHDLRAPLGSIRAAVQGLEKGLFGELTPDQREVLLGIDVNQRFLASKIDGIMDGAKLEADKLTLALVPVSLERVCRQMLRLVAPEAESKGLALRCDVGDVVVLADERRLAQIVLNLLANAVKFTERGEIALEAAHDGETVRFVVRDTGAGIPLERQATLFERYGSSEAGSGLGMWLVKRLVEAHQGTIQVESEPGKGTAIAIGLTRS